MKKRKTVLILGITSILVLISVQVWIINGIRKQKDEMFNLRYRVFSQDALSSLYRRTGSYGFDTARYIINAYSEQAAKAISEIKNDTVLASRKKDVLEYITKALYQEQDLSPFLSNYFERLNIDKNFTFKIVINRFELINNDVKIPVYISDMFANRMDYRQGITPRHPFIRRASSEILVKGDHSET